VSDEQFNPFEGLPEDLEGLANMPNGHPIKEMIIGTMLGKAVDDLHQVTAKFEGLARLSGDLIVGLTFETLHNFNAVVMRTLEKLRESEDISLADTDLGDWAKMVKDFVESHGGGTCNCPSCQAQQLNEEEVQQGISELEQWVNGEEEEEDKTEE